MTEWMILTTIGLVSGLGVNILADVVPGIGRPGYRVETERWPRRIAVLAAGFPLAGLALAGEPLASWPGNPRAGQLLASVYLAAFLLILVIDIEHRRVPNLIVYPLALGGLLVALLSSPATLGTALLGGLAGYTLFRIIALVRPGGMGEGDVKLAGLLGILLGFPHILSALVLGILAGGVGALLLLATRRTGFRGTMAYAPYLVCGAAIVLLGGSLNLFPTL